MSGRLALCVALALAPVGGCSGDGGIKDEELEGLVISPPEEPPAIDLDKATSKGDELGRAFALRHREVAKRLGAHTVKVTSRYEVKEGDQLVEQLSDETLLEVSGDGEYHAKYDNSRDYGREVIFQGGQLFLRPRYAKWHRRAPNDEHEALAIREQMYAVLGDYFDVVDHAAEVTDKGTARAADRDGRRVEIKLAPSPRKPPPERLTQRKWRETVTVQELTGDAVLDAEGAFPLEARLSAKFVFVRDGRTFTQTIEVGHAISGVGQPVALATPPAEETVTTPERSRDVDERDALLEGMAPPAKQAGGPPVVVPDESGPKNESKNGTKK